MNATHWLAWAILGWFACWLPVHIASYLYR